jgi:phosphate-selective porin OprO/OprP
MFEVVAAVAAVMSLSVHSVPLGHRGHLAFGHPAHDAQSASRAEAAPNPPAADPSQTPSAPREPKGDGTRRPEGLIWDEGPSWRIGRFGRIDFKARLQEDVRRSSEGADSASDLDAFELSRFRVGMQGRLFDGLDFEIERELSTSELTAEDVAQGERPKSAWRDVSLEVGYLRAAQIRVGRFKIPFGLDQLTSATRGDFVYRSLGADYLAPSRDVGVMVHGIFFDRALGYSTGVFRRDGDNARSRRSQGADLTYATRLTAAPLRQLDGLEFGTAVTISDLSNEQAWPNGLRGRTVMTESPLFDAVYVNGRRVRWESDLQWLAGAASLRAEYTRVTDERRGQGLTGQDLPDARYTAWYVSGTCLLTGDKKRRPLRPRRELLRGGIGAVEVAARYEHIRFDSAGSGGVALRNPRAETILPNGDRVLTLGVNWLLNRWITLQVNGIREQIEDGKRSPLTGSAPFWNGVLRLQFVL